MNKSIIAIFFILTLLLESGSARALTVESIAATVEDRIITAGDVITESKLLKIHGSQYAHLPLEGAFSKELLDQMINRDLVYREAMRAKFEFSESKVIDEMLDFERKFNKTEEFPLFLKEEGLLLGDIVEWFHKIHITRDYISEKISLMSYVGEAEIEKYYRKNSENYQGRSLESVENEIRAQLLQKKGEDFLEEWISDLRRRGKVKYFILPPDQPLR